MIASVDKESGGILALRGEVARLEQRVLAEGAAHDATRHRLACRERELERLRGNFYSGRVADVARIAELEVGVRECLAAMEIQEGREAGAFFVGQEAALAIWDEAKVIARAALEDA